MTRQDKATILFALEYLKANFHDCQELLADSIFFTRLVGDEVRPPQSADEVQVLIQQLIKEDRPADQVKLSYVLQDDGLAVQKGSSLQELLDAGGELIDESMEPPVVLFMMEDDDHWFAGSVEMAVHEANPALVCDEIAMTLDTLDPDDPDDHREIVFLESELNKLPSRERLSELPPPADPAHNTYQFFESGYDPQKLDEANASRVWLVNAPNQAAVRYYAANRAVSFEGLRQIEKHENDDNIDAVVNVDGKVIWEATWRRE